MVIRRASGSTLIYIVLTLLGLFFLMPMIWLVLASITPHATLEVQFPTHPALTNFITIIGDGLVARPFMNSFILSISTMFLVIILSGLAAYPLSRRQFRLKAYVMYCILFASALPVLALVTPLYAMYNTLRLTDTMQGCVLFFTASSLPFSIWLMKNFLDGVPIELEEAAWIDGASMLASFRHIMLPLAAPGVAVVGVWSFIGAWANFFIPLIILQSQDLFPASIHIYNFFGSYGEVDYGQLTAYAILYALPCVILYTLVSRFFVKGMSGGLKG
ncbi:carbohydrate ABC transporter permease [Ktedonosporobacter rubrisoli]|uniref:Carbohydrate ABC transporter permease n=1 Tax=Ktedonosporobacter rubrisoli TaxID=2509675 RepID=A0A4P6JQJ1_KTERU|nr:carbohydrate ABC transporter permease [Ktedonosporobacter rubrisoli]QBD77440.1 carbohydrate ABC transporter permease [Ktedonosporobacter rubrisoli]